MSFPGSMQKRVLRDAYNSYYKEELQQILEYFTTQIKVVEKALGSARKKRASPISASLPNIESAYFLDRIGALKKSLASKNETKTSESTDAAPKSKYESHLAPNPLITNVRWYNDHSVDSVLHFNDTIQDCKRLTQPELVAELKQRGTYNPELMAWDALGVIRFLDRTIHDHYQRQPPRNRQREEAFSRNVEALASLLKELNVTGEPRRSILSPSLRRSKRKDQVEEILRALNATKEKPGRAKDQPLTLEDDNLTPRQKLIGHV
ncbi:hypothetical protein ANCDUO_07032 [Ancylostoma duodenale]|uniref:Uncharacterized protein n=1 Tax=Ancylostoma duodenale TaxID=51022 RepID=A0A0C2GZZ2_9BILA|nr:hypothetical protein ANCDUO_07032 [Ancylostoma duodenale]